MTAGISWRRKGLVAAGHDPSHQEMTQMDRINLVPSISRRRESTNRRTRGATPHRGCPPATCVFCPEDK
ncbi:hypothetical protein Q8A67_020224 [Cirrhinus molitorella]|uniref:Uncharacterized protein n=1 Tax=Cirrhinus molitorella TaxID=172907 RepID=A0AA88P4W2_9TELE|nr:hypothetical protein Q8A67_020224 [Cirrhinus molitorella]